MVKPGAFRRWLMFGGLGLLALILAGVVIWYDDILRTTLDPKEPFQTYDPPHAPDYAQRASWALLPKDPAEAIPALPPTAGTIADVFFIYPTAYNGGRHWNAPIDNEQTNHELADAFLPNYAGPFVRNGRLFAPRYRQASLYSQLTTRDDAREARRFAYNDVLKAFQQWRDHYGTDRPFYIVGVEQGAFLASRLLTEEVAPNPALRRRLAGAYLINAVIPAEDFGPTSPIPACMRRAESGCVVGWAQAYEGDTLHSNALLSRSLVWGEGGDLENLGDRPALCVNPLLGAATETPAPARLSLGAVNATGLEWSARPAFMQRQVATRCGGGILWVTRPKSPSLKMNGHWPDQFKVAPYNLFYADLEADGAARWEAWREGAMAAAATAPQPSGPNSSAGRSSPGR